MRTNMSGKWVGIPDKCILLHNLSGLKRFLADILPKIGNLSVKPYHFTDKF
mgnify:CR=1 FL=1